VLEAILVASPEPLTASELAATLHAAAKAARDEERERIEENLDTARDDADEPAPEGEGDAGGRRAAADPSSVREALRSAQAARPEAAFAKVGAGEVAEALCSLARTYAESGRAFTVLERAGGWKIFTRAEFAPWVKQLYPERKPERFSGPAMETLAIIAYRQPITKAAIEAVRGVSCDGVLQKLLDRNIVKIGGRADLPGRPLLYETTDLFFEHFGIRGVDDLPNAAELRSVPLPEPAPPAQDEAAPAEPTELAEGSGAPGPPGSEVHGEVEHPAAPA
jgi:segregation and condensation protein B